MWWPAKENFKGATQAGKINTTSGSFLPPVDLKIGVIIEARVTLPAKGAALNFQPGFAFGLESGGSLRMVIDAVGRGTLVNSTTAICMGVGAGVLATSLPQPGHQGSANGAQSGEVIHIWDRELGLLPGAEVMLRLLYRR